MGKEKVIDKERKEKQTGRKEWSERRNRYIDKEGKRNIQREGRQINTGKRNARREGNREGERDREEKIAIIEKKEKDRNRDTQRVEEERDNVNCQGEEKKTRGG